MRAVVVTIIAFAALIAITYERQNATSQIALA
jgi:hypothetical protein